MEGCCGIPLDPSLCPRCGLKGTPVMGKTLSSLLKDEFAKEIRDKVYYFCIYKGCSVVYFREGFLFTKDKLKVRVGLKEEEPPIPLCYCFGITKEDIIGEIKKKGVSTASERIKKEIKAGNCFCEIKNPSGRCCLGDVVKAENGRRWGQVLQYNIMYVILVAWRDL